MILAHGELVYLLDSGVIQHGQHAAVEAAIAKLG